MSVNWFTALEGKVARKKSGAEITAEILAKRPSMSRSLLELREAEYDMEVPKRWAASSDHVVGITGFGDTPEEAIRDFETKMRLPGEWA